MRCRGNEPAHSTEAYTRQGKHPEQTAGKLQRGYAVVDCDTSLMASIVRLVGDRASVACFNSPSNYVFAGTSKDVLELEQQLRFQMGDISS